MGLHFDLSGWKKFLVGAQTADPIVPVADLFLLSGTADRDGRPHWKKAVGWLGWPSMHPDREVYWVRRRKHLGETGMVLIERFLHCLIVVHSRWVFLTAVLKSVVSYLTLYSIERGGTRLVEEIAASIDAVTRVMDRLSMRPVDPMPGFVTKLLAS